MIEGTVIVILGLALVVAFYAWMVRGAKIEETECIVAQVKAENASWQRWCEDAESKIPRRDGRGKFARREK